MGLMEVKQFFQMYCLTHSKTEPKIPLNYLQIIVKFQYPSVMFK